MDTLSASVGSGLTGKDPLLELKHTPGLCKMVCAGVQLIHSSHYTHAAMASCTMAPSTATRCPPIALTPPPAIVIAPLPCSPTPLSSVLRMTVAGLNLLYLLWDSHWHGSFRWGCQHADCITVLAYTAFLTCTIARNSDNGYIFNGRIDGIFTCHAIYISRKMVTCRACHSCMVVRDAFTC